MDDKKVNINRPKVSTSEIEEKKNFEQLMNQIGNPQNPYYKKIGFWGKMGLAGVALAMVTQFTLDFISTSKEQKFADNTPAEYKGSGEPRKSVLTPFSAENDVAFEEFLVIVGQNSSLELSDGTKIHIQKTSFNDIPYGAKIKVKARVFKDKTDAFFAGVPMDYEEDAFESAGMVEIRAFHNEKEVEINPSSPLDVELSLYKHPDAFNFYSLDNETGDWNEYPANFNVSVNRDLKIDQDQIDELQKEVDDLSIHIKSLKKENDRFKMNDEKDYFIPKHNQLILDVNLDESKYPDTKFSKDKKNFRLEALVNQRNFSKVYNKPWKDIKVQKINDTNYEIVYSSETETEKLKARPVLTGNAAVNAIKNFENAKKNFLKTKEELEKKISLNTLQLREKKKQLEQLITSKNKINAYSNGEIDEKQITKKNSAVQQGILSAKAKFKLKTWGVYNADRPVSYPTQLIPPIQFANSENKSDAVKETHVFDLEKDVRYSFGSKKHKLEEFGIFDHETIIIVVFESGKIGFIETNKSDLEENEGAIDIETIDKADFGKNRLRRLLHDKRFSA